MTAIANLPDLRPNLLLDFANSERVDPRIQCTRASSATCFGPNGKLRTVAANVPRIDYDPVTGKCLGLLVEETRTNLLASSSAFGSAGWTLSSAILQETTITSSLGAKLQKFLIPTGYTASNSSIRHSDITKSATSITYTLTVIAKAGENNFLRLLPRDTTTASNSVDARFNLTTGETFPSTASGTYNLVSTGMKHLGDGLYECTVVFTTGTETGIRVQILQMLNNGAVAGNDINGIYLAGSQLEVGAFPTSYIPTEASAVTRAADQVFIEGPAFTGAMIFAQGAVLCSYTARSALGTQIVLQARSAALQSGFAFQFTAAGGARNRALIEVASGSPPIFSTRPVEASVKYKAGLSWASDKAHNVLSGGFISTVTQSIDIGAPQRLGLGGNGYGGSPFTGHIHDASLYARYLQPEQLQRLTT